MEMSRRRSVVAMLAAAAMALAMTACATRSGSREVTWAWLDAELARYQTQTLWPTLRYRGSSGGCDHFAFQRPLSLSGRPEYLRIRSDARAEPDPFPLTSDESAWRQVFPRNTRPAGAPALFPPVQPPPR